MEQARPAGADSGPGEARPRIDPALCVHTLCALATCARCVEACPAGAWQFSDTALALDVSLCDGCGLCRPACPESAIDFGAQAFSPLIDVAEERVMLACDRSGVAAGRGVVPCVHAFGERELAQWGERGLRTVLVARGDCVSCPRATAETLEAAVEQLRALRASQGRKAFRLEEAPASRWSRTRREAEAQRHDLDQGRRRLFTFSLAAEVRGAVSGRTGEGAEAGRLARHAPLIDPGRCTGCDACARVCPHSSIALSREASGLAYRIQPATCTGCHLCADVCDSAAVKVEHMAPAAARVVVLSEHHCMKCGAPFHQPAREPEPADLAHEVEQSGTVCRICAKTSHASKLFQVRS